MEEGSVSAYRRLRGALPIRCTRGRIPDWDQDPISGDNACRRLKGFLQDLDDRANEELSLLRQQVLMPLLHSLQTAVLKWASERKRLGRAEFQDLLVWTRDLLQDNLDVRDFYRSRYSHLLIDEAQDTDPLQAEIAMFLAEEAGESAAGGSRPRVWEDVIPQRGKLFVVGDPKQSIYRFRRADIEQMKVLQEHLDGDTVQLVQNCRSQKPVVNWVNHLFALWMGEGSLQTEYVPLEHRWEAETNHPAGPRVWSLGGRLDESAERFFGFRPLAIQSPGFFYCRSARGSSATCPNDSSMEEIRVSQGVGPKNLRLEAYKWDPSRREACSKNQREG